MTLIELVRHVSSLIGTPAAVLAGIAAALVVISRDWRLTMFAYLAENVMLAVLLVQIIPVEWALLQAIVAGLIGVIIYMSARQLRPVETYGPAWIGRWPQMATLTIFRMLTTALAAVTFLAIRTEVTLPVIRPPILDLFLWLVLIGLLGLALHEEPLHAGLSLLTVVAGSQLLIFTLMPQRILVGALGAVQILLGLAVSYLVLSRGLASAAVTVEHGRLDAQR